MQAVINLFTVLDTVHWEVRAADARGEWSLLCRGVVPDPDAPTEADTIAYVMGEASEDMHAHSRRGYRRSS